MPDLTNIDETRLSNDGFTKPGIDHFQKVVLSYGTELLRRTVLRADAEKADDTKREVTSMHVRQAAREIAAKPPRKSASALAILGQVSEYVLTAGAGVGAGHLEQQPGIIAFGVCLSLATVLLVTRLARGRS